MRRSDSSLLIRASLRSSAALLVLLAVALAWGCGSATTSARERARAAYIDADYEEAAEAYEEFLAEAPEGPEAEEARFRLADVYYLNLKRYEQARDNYALLLERYPGSQHAYDARKKLAEVHVELGAIREAIVEYERLLADHPGTPDARKVRSTIGDLYFEGDDLRQAEVEYARVLENAPYDELAEQALLRLASIHHLMRKEEERAVPLYERVIASTADPAVRRRALFSLSQAYADMFRFDEAIAVLERVDDPAEAAYVAERRAELERQKREHADAPEVDWSDDGKGEN